jgi:hypothetical protein
VSQRTGQRLAGQQQERPEDVESQQGDVERQHPDHDRRQSHDVEHDDLFPGRAGRSVSFPKIRAQDDRENHGCDGTEHQQRQAGRTELVGQTPDVVRDEGERGCGDRGHQGPRQPDRQPPGRIGAQHPE